MWCPKSITTLFVIYFGLNMCEATVLELLQIGTGTTATYTLGVNTLGTLLTGSVGGALGLGLLAGLKKGTRRQWRYRGKREEPIQEIQELPEGELPKKSPSSNDQFQMVESLDKNDCGKRLLCEEAYLLNHPVEGSGYSDDEEDDTDDVDFSDDDPIPIDEVGRLILEFVTNIPADGVNPKGSRVPFLSAVNLGANGGSCLAVYHRCPFNRAELLKLIIQSRIFD